MLIIWNSKHSKSKIEQNKWSKESNSTKGSVKESVKITTSEVIHLKPSTRKGCKRKNKKQKCDTIAMMNWI